MTLRFVVDGEDYTLEVPPDASVVEVAPGVFSVLLGYRSFTVHVAPLGGELEVWTSGERHIISVADVRDRPGGGRKTAGAGPVEIRSQMPGKVIKLLTTVGDAVEAGQGVIVVEAMKMQNEMKSPKGGVVSKILVQEGATVGAGETLVIVE